MYKTVFTETIFVQCTLPEETTGSHNRESSTTKNELTPISIKDMFQDQSTGASNAIQELLSKSGISADSIFLEPNLIQTPMNSLDLMDKMVTPASFGEDKTERTQPNVPSSSTFANNTTQTPLTFTNNITTEENTETTVASTTLFETTTQEISESNVVSSSASSSTNAIDSSTTAETSSTTSTASSTLSSTTSTSSTTSVQESSTTSKFSTKSVQEKDTQSPVDESSAATTSAPTKEENIPSSSRLSTSLPTTKSTTSSAPNTTTLATEEKTTHSGEYTTMSEERTTNSISTTSQLSTTTSRPEETTSDSIMLNFDITQHTTSTTKAPVEFSSTEKSADITTSVLSTTILGMVSSSEGKSSSSTPHSDLTTSVLSSTPTSFPETTSQKDHLRLETSRGKTESTTSDIKPTRTLIDETTTQRYKNSSVRDGIVSSMEISTPMYNTVLPDLNELYSEELLRLASSTVVPYSQSTRGSTETPKSDITVTGSPNLSTEKHAKEQEKTTKTPNTTTDSPVAIKEEAKTTQQFTSTTAKTSASTTTRVEPTAQTDEPSTEEPSTARTTSKDITTVKPTTTTVKTTSTTFKPTTKEVVPTESKPTTQDPASNESSTPKLIMAPSNNPRGDTAHVHTEHPTEKPAIVEKPVMTRLPPIVIPVDSTKQITFKPSFTPGHNHGAKNEESKPKPPADLSTVNDTEQLDDDTITGRHSV